MKNDPTSRIVFEKLDDTTRAAIDRMAEDFKLAVALVARLRGRDGCPWDREQDHLTLRPYLIEEAYEVLDQLDRFERTRDPKEAAKSVKPSEPVPKNGKFPKGVGEKVREELGDLLLQVILHSELSRERGEFDVGGVARAMVEKLVVRHPHVFGSTDATNSDQVLKNWELIKSQEKKDKGEERTSVLDGLPKALPSLQRAARIGEKAKGVGFDWPDWKGSLEKVDEEIAEVKEAIESGNREHMEHELGDLFFATCNLARHLKIQPEDAHRKAIERFETRFREVERIFKERGKDMLTATLPELDEVWEQVKKKAP